MKTLKNVKTIQTKAKINKILKSVTKKKEREVGAVHPEPGEIQQIIRGKLRDRIHKQRDYREYVLIRIKKQEKLKYLNDMIKLAIAKEKELGEAIVEFGGFDMSLGWAKAEYNHQYHLYINTIREEQRLYDFLTKSFKNGGCAMTKKEMKLVMQGKYKKEFKDIDTDPRPKSQRNGKKKKKDKKLDYVG
jgi:hypothetical protein